MSRVRVRLSLAVLAVGLCAGRLAAGCGSDAALGTRVYDKPTAQLASGEVTPFPFFSSTSFWNQPLAAGAALDPNSARLVGALGAEVRRELEAGGGPWINTTDYGVPIYTVPADQPTVRVQLSSQFYAPALQAAWSAVPLPPGARPSAGSDHTLVVWQPSTNRLWEFWRLTREPGLWRASWGGAIQGVSSNWGAYGPGAWKGAQSTWGASASSLSIAGGLITLKDLQRGRIEHALALAVPNTRAGVYASPARRTDGSSWGSASLPEGARLRLDPTLDLTKLHLPWLTLMIAEAAQRYGIFVRDKSKAVHFFAQDPSPTGTDPYLGAAGYFEGETPSQLLAQFPWGRLQVLRMELHEFSSGEDSSLRGGE